MHISQTVIKKELLKYLVLQVGTLKALFIQELDLGHMKIILRDKNLESILFLKI